MLVVFELEGGSGPDPRQRFADLGLPGGPIMMVPGFEEGEKAFMAFKVPRRLRDLLADCKAITDGPGQAKDTRHMVAFYHGTDCKLSRWMTNELDRVRTGKHATEFPYCSRREAGGMFEWLDIADIPEVR